MILFINYSIDYLTKPDSIYISLEYAGSDVLFLGCSFFFYVICIIIIECNAYSVKEFKDDLLPKSEEGEKDKEVQKEIKKANKISDESMNEEEDINNPNIKTRKNQNIYIENVEDLIYNGNQDSNKDFVLNLNDNNQKKM